MTRPSDEQLRAILVDMVEARAQAGRLWNLQRQGQIGTLAPIDGHEAVVAATAHALDPASDWILPQYREPLALQRFGPEVLSQYMLYNIGHPDGSRLPPSVRVAPLQISLATQIPHAVGLAWGMTLRHQPGVTTVFFGDGSSSEGDFHEAANLAGVLRAPVILLCVNNQWAISTPLHQQTAAESLADRAVGYGIPGIRVDGNDAAAVFDAVDEARRLALDGGGPTLIEATVYRLGAHTTADDPTRYVPAEDLEAARANDPVYRLADHLGELGLWNEDTQAQVEAAALMRIDEAFKEAMAQPLATDAVFNHCFISDTPRMARQRAALLATGPDDHSSIPKVDR
ncbi:MAG: thiamine pyrophosphate-dependent enzyme [Actinomycetota bacterium]|nr:thiamine pyrophosphate-dependent enzyme [Actinomycetota bacterium]